MPARPEIFISATTKDLKSCRQLVRDALLTLGCVPVVQDHFAPEAATVREMLRKRIAECDAVIHLAGTCYGYEPQERAAGEPRRSYTQMEYDIAHELKKPVYTFVCAPDFPYDAHEPEDDERRSLQDDHRAVLMGSERLFVPVGNKQELERSVRELRFQTRSWIKRLGAAVAVGLLLISVSWWYLDRRAATAEGRSAVLQQQNDIQAREIAELHAELNEQTRTGQRILAIALRDAPEVKAGEKSDPVAIARAQVAAERKISMEELQKQLAGERADVKMLLARIEKESAAAQTQVEQWKKLKRDALIKWGDGEAAAGHYRESVEPYQQAFALCDEGKDPLGYCYAAQKLGVALWSMGRYAEAEPLGRKVMEQRTTLQGAENHDTLASVNDLANVVKNQGGYAEAESLYRRCMETCERTLGKEHPDTLLVVNNLAGLLRDKGDFSGAESLYRRCLAACERTLGKEHLTTSKIMNNLAGLLCAKGDYTEAEALSRRCAEVLERALGKEHPDTLRSIDNLAGTLEAQDNQAEAESLYWRSLEARERTLGREHPDTLASINSLASTLAARGIYTKAESLYRRCLEAQERTLGKEHPSALSTANNLANVLKHRGEYAEAESLYRRCIEAQERTLGKEHPYTLASNNNLADLLRLKGDYASAESICKYSLEIYERTLGAKHPYVVIAAFDCSLLQAEQGKFDEALGFAEKAVAAARANLPENHPLRLKCERQLADVQAKIAVSTKYRR